MQITKVGSIGLKIFSYIIIALILLSFIALVGIIFYNHNLYQENLRQNSQGHAAAQAITEMIASGLQMGQATRNIILDPENPQAYKNFEWAKDNFKKNIDELSTQITNKSGLFNKADQELVIKDIKEIHRLWSEDLLLHRQAQTLGKERLTTEAIQILNKHETPIWREYRSKMLDLRKYLQEKMDKLNSTIHQREQKMQWFVWTMITFFFLLLLYVVRCWQQAFLGLGKCSQELSYQADSLGDIALSMTNTSQQLAQGASEQAASLQETSSSLEEMSSMTKQNANHANHANALMNESNLVVHKTAQSMSELMRAMNDISAASKETAKIIKTIDDIAFQTNLLALNAAVEAARAGEAGAGFSIVADEVRNLARRAADAAQNTANLIEGTVAKVQEGSELVHKTAEDFTLVAITTDKAKELVSEIAVASHEQAQGVNQISKAVFEIDKVVQQNAAIAEESASASQELSAQASQVNGIIGELLSLVVGNHQGRNGYPDPARNQCQQVPQVSLAYKTLTLADRVKTMTASKANRLIWQEPGIPLVASSKKLIPID